MSDYRYFEMGEGDKDYWRTCGPLVEFRTKAGEWERSVLPLPMFLGEVAEFGREITPPDETSEHGHTFFLWGQGPHPYDVPTDPIPEVFSNGCDGGTVSFDDFQLDLDAAEGFAERILNAVRWQRSQMSGSVTPERGEKQ